MRNSKARSVALTAVLFVSAGNSVAADAQHSSVSSTSVKDGWVTVAPAEFPGAINNPLKDFRAYKKGGYGLLERKYIKWSEIEVSADDTVERIIAYTTKITQTKGKRFEELNIKLVPRVYLDWRTVAKEATFTLTEQWQEQSGTFEIKTTFKDETTLRFRLPSNTNGFFDLSHTRLKRVK